MVSLLPTGKSLISKHHNPTLIHHSSLIFCHYLPNSLLYGCIQFLTLSASCSLPYATTWCFLCAEWSLISDKLEPVHQELVQISAVQIPPILWSLSQFPKADFIIPSSVDESTLLCLHYNTYQIIFSLFILFIFVSSSCTKIPPSTLFALLNHEE